MPRINSRVSIEISPEESARLMAQKAYARRKAQQENAKAAATATQYLDLLETMREHAPRTFRQAASLTLTPQFPVNVGPVAVGNLTLMRHVQQVVGEVALLCPPDDRLSSCAAAFERALKTHQMEIADPLQYTDGEAPTIATACATLCHLLQIFANSEASMQECANATLARCADIACARGYASGGGGGGGGDECCVGGGGGGDDCEGGASGGSGEHGGESGSGEIRAESGSGERGGESGGETKRKR